MTAPTITALEMRAALGHSPKSIGTFQGYCRRYPHGFVVLKLGARGRGKGGASNATLYDRKAFKKWLKARKTMQGR